MGTAKNKLRLPNVNIQTNVPYELYKEVVEFAEARGTSRSAIGREALKKYISVNKS